MKLPSWISILVVAVIPACVSHAVSAWPAQIEMRVPFEPTAFSSGGKTYLAYELYLTDFGSDSMALRRIDILDADKAGSKPINSFESESLRGLLRGVGGDSEGRSGPYELPAGGTVVVYLWVVIDHGTPMPNRLAHRLTLADSITDGPVVTTHHIQLLVLGPPVRGKEWLAGDGPGNGSDNHHRRGLLVVDGHPQISRRFAIDWQQVDNGATFSGDASDKRSYHSYGRPVMAVSDATVVLARDGLPDNVPGHNEGFHPAVPITPDTVAGNAIVLDLGGQQFAHYLHLQAGSLRVRVGDRVRLGQWLANIGGSGDAREPHLHFQVSTSLSPLGGEGVPYLIDGYKAKSADASWGIRSHELPLDGMVVDFGEAGAVSREE